MHSWPLYRVVLYNGALRMLTRKSSIKRRDLSVALHGQPFKSLFYYRRIMVLPRGIPGGENLVKIGEVIIGSPPKSNGLVPGSRLISPKIIRSRSELLEIFCSQQMISQRDRQNDTQTHTHICITLLVALLPERRLVIIVLYCKIIVGVLGARVYAA